ncbi:T9SS type A sorting domain-containing protein [Pontibacter sp. E15-1]|uniref:type IX secretion system anionic LPS delivery protein PorZ n=1 Tax=Pontibacter sp. E15-1 TaxID=2919918 RepID=UPI001F4F30C9|nr:T9SS type A sorting domain-containing protein [Pontibacter sp. E15-1]MCJ8166945.1 T9SS type A sorting domain-containing protein [Pontibacter sp. E15-1]
MEASATAHKNIDFAYRCLVAVLALLLLSGQGYGQSSTPLGSWQVHVPYQQARAVADAGDRVYVAAPNGLFYYDKEFNTTKTVSKVDGLREQRISTIGYDAATSTLVIAYANTQVDLLRGNTLYNIPDIFRKTISGEKKINRITIADKLAYLSTSFGVVVLDLQRLEIKNTYSNLGPTGEVVSVQAAAILRDSIYVSTDIGLLAARRAGANLQDFHNWSGMGGGLPTPNAASSLAAFNGQLYAGTSGNGVYALHAGSWQQIAVGGNTAIRSLTAANGYLAIATPDGITLLHTSRKITALAHALLAQPQEAVVGSEGRLWVADGANGLVQLATDGTGATAFAPNGPYSTNSFRLYTHGGKAYVLSGGYNESYLDASIHEGFYVYEEGRWVNYNQFLYPDPQAYVPARDLVAAAYNPVTDKMYFASYGNGLLEWGGLGNAVLHNNGNSTLVSSLTPEDRNYVRVTDVAVDAEGSVWAVNRNQLANMPGLHRLQPDGTWSAFVLPGVADGSNLDKLLIDDYGRKWLSISRRRNTKSGLVVFDDTRNLVRSLSVGDGNGGLPDGAVYSMAKDLNGDVWVGTANGAGVYYTTEFVFESQPYDAHLPIISGRPLLNGQTVRAIAVDGANRKWMGTDNGLWLFSPDGDELLRHYTAQNSPLPSDKVLSVAVEHQTGVVFVATEGGIASYRAGATITEGKPECATVFPNPVRRDYTGLIGVSGLPNNAHVRITDISGTLVYKTRATGGTLSWDARDYNGKRVKAGVYLVMSADETGGQTCISKIAVLE